jgi:hypothetical protein
MKIDDILHTEYTVELNHNEEKFILISESVSKVLASIDGPTGFNLSFLLSNDSSDYFESKSLRSDIQWEYLLIKDMPTTSITSPQNSILFDARNIIWIRNTGITKCKVSLRGNRS